MPIVTRQNSILFEPLEVPREVYDAYLRYRALKIELADGRQAPLFQSLDPKICEFRRDIMLTALGFDDVNKRILNLEALGRTAPEIGEIVNLSASAVNNRKETIHHLFGSGEGNVASFIAGAFGCFALKKQT